jgi:hypothetical protein
MAIEIVSFKPFQKNTLQGFATIQITNIGIEIRDVTLHGKNGKRSIQLPSKPYEKDGKAMWAFILDFYDKARSEQFQKAALDAFLSKGRRDGDGF